MIELNGIQISDNNINTKKNVKIYVDENKLNIENGIIKVTYNELKTLKDSKKLVPGQQYRIIDYTAYILEFDLISVANHYFDIILFADTNESLNENARVTWNENDHYFDNNNLTSWEVKYCFDDYTRVGDWIPNNNKEYLCCNALDGYTEYYFIKQLIKDNEVFYLWSSEDYQDGDYGYLTKSIKPKKGDYLIDTDGEESEVSIYYNPEDRRGFIYYLKDEFNNCSTFDFKNIKNNNCYLFGTENEDYSLVYNNTIKVYNNTINNDNNNSSEYSYLIIKNNNFKGKKTYNNIILSSDVTADSDFYENTLQDSKLHVTEASHNNNLKCLYNYDYIKSINNSTIVNSQLENIGDINGCVLFNTGTISNKTLNQVFQFHQRVL